MPLNGDLRNYGTIKLPSPSRTQVTYGNGKMGTSAACIIGWHLDEEILGNTWSVAMWVKPSSLGQYNNILFSKNISSSSDCQIYFSIMSNNALNLGLNNHSSDVTGAASFANGTWYHVAATYDGTTATIYLNGQELNHKTVSSTYSSDKLNINLNGRSSNATNTTYTGWFGSSYNDFRLYDNCISAAEVRELARGLVLHYKMGHQNIQPSLLQNGYNFTADNFALTRATVPEQGLLQITPTGSGAYAKYKTGLEYSDANNKRYVASFDAQEIESTNSSYTTDYIRFYYGFSGPSREDVIIGSADYYTYRNIQLLGTGWQHYVAIFEVPGPLASGDSAAMTDGATLAFQFGRRGSKKPLQVKNIKLELDSETIIYDSSGFGNHGETTGEIVYQTDTPRYNTCTHFETTSEKIKISNFPTSGFGDSYTFSWWAKANSLAIMQWGFSDGIRLNGMYKCDLWNTGDSSDNPLYVPNTTTQVTTPAINTWYHWAMTGDGTSCKVYKNGELFGIAKTYKSISGTEIYINGWDNTTGYSSANLSISDFRIYCTALDAAAVKELYSLGAKIDNKQNLHTFELEEAGGPELLAIPFTTSYGNRTNIYTAYNDDGEITLTGSSSIGSNYIPISPTGKVYYFDIDVSIDAGNQFYIGFERFDVNKAATSNSSCDYVVNVKPSSALVHQHYFGTRTWTANLSTGKPPAYIALRILNDWSGANGRKATIHSVSLREVSTLTNEQILKTGITKADEFIEGEKIAIQKNKIIRSKNFIEL